MIRYIALFILILALCLAVALLTRAQSAHLPTTTVRLDPQSDGSVILIPYLPVVFVTSVVAGSPKKGPVTCIIHERTLDCSGVTLHIDKTNFGVSQ